MTDENQGIVYLLSNPAMPGFVKIGSTTHDTVGTRMSQLYTTGVPFPFTCDYAARVSNVATVEKALHTAFSPDRINVRREFFEIDTAQAIAVIKLLEIEDVTPQVVIESDTPVDHEDRQAGKAYSKKRPQLNFIEMDIPIGSILTANSNGETASVLSAKTVQFKGEEMSLTAATRAVLDYSYSVAPTPHWNFEGRNLRDIYNETYTREI